MKKIKYLSLILSFLFFGVLFSNVAPAKASDLKLYGFENIYGHDNISCGATYYNDGDDCDSIYFHYRTNLNIKKNQKLYFLLNDPYGLDYDTFWIEFKLLSEYKDLSFSVHYDSDNFLTIGNKTDVVFEKLDYYVTNNYSYEWYPFSVEADSEGVFESIDFKGNLYCLDFSNIEIYDEFYLDYVDVSFHMDGNQPKLNYDEGDFANLYNYNDCYFELLFDEFILQDPVFLNSVYSENNKMVLSFCNVPEYYNFRSVLIHDKSGLNTYNLNYKCKADNGNTEYIVEGINLSENGNNSYSIYNSTYNVQGRSYVMPHNLTVNYVTKKVVNQCYAFSYAQIKNNFIGWNIGSDIFVKLYDDLLLMILSSEFELNTYAKGFLLDMLDIKVKKVDRGLEKNTIKTSPKWLKFLDNVKKCKVVVQSKLESSLMSSKAWYKRSITKLDTLISICNDSFDENFLSNILMEKKENIEQMFSDEKFKLKDLAKINSYRRKLGLVDFKSIDELRNHIMNVYDNSVKKLLE